ncbi:5'-nucleotidase C-terminal domain-containing protein [Ancylomarina longa]|uniref:5'-Nucleotidase C-terminal domain-containing protein n=1 Tax=Ancylomarina longa TaxID=2487017 RepID=A0A434AFC3_9BACT|nr:5'-nucleotidase [Ancylomarina longa]RUT73069.1 hypothetical protein DLK05_15170 [Ancylomarina longa]
MKRKFDFAIRFLLILFLFSACSGTNNSNKLEYKAHYAVDSLWDQASQSDTAFQHVIANYKVQLDDQMNKVLGICDKDMIARKPESDLSNFVADAMLEIGKTYCEENHLSHSVDIAVMNQGGIRTALAKGKITTGRIFEMLPFKNKLVIVSMDGKQLKGLLDQIASFGGEGIGGMKMGMKEKKAVEISIDGKPLQEDHIYYVISIDYLVNGGGGLTAFANRKTFRHLHQKLRNEIITYLLHKQEIGEHITAKLDGRLYHVE